MYYYQDSPDIEKLLQWLEIREKSGYPYPKDLIQLHIEIQHSALLRRLLCGKEPLTHPPPTSYSYPWYYIIEEGHATSCDICEDKILHEPDLVLVINQHIWEVLEKVSDDEYICRYAPWSTSLWRVVHTKHSEEHFDNVWTITRIVESVGAKLL